MHNPHKLVITGAALIACVFLFLNIFLREMVDIRTIDIRDHLSTANSFPDLEDTLHFMNSKSNITSDALYQHFTDLKQEKQNRAITCLRNAVRERDVNVSRFWGKEEHIRTTHHTYLRNKDAGMIEIGGNRGDDATEFVKLVKVVIVGLGIKNKVAMVNNEGVDGDATSKFLGSNGKTPLYIANATKFLMNLGVGLFHVDLLTTNCEGCEYEVLETILSTNLINYIKNFQFATHSTLKGLEDPLGRYCKIQELLRRTHKPTL
ncbi:hypothetical protein ACJMK2_025328 [Sinanodonta woodiana]|uniref:Methyltransferase FkbM domain-containing protein n=1 Tax=Sinanodonta woodiana TaxID=1069815 RepID=A0ABD3XHN4_SINWO